jgi:tetratricopeptide (TPR) repeat protein
MQVCAAIEEVMDAPELLDAGQELLAAAARKVQTLDQISRAYAPDWQNEQVIRERLERHRRELPEPVRPLPRVMQRFDPAWSRKLGVSMPPPINYAASGTVRRENVSDVVQLAAYKNDTQLAEWTVLLACTAESEPESAALVQGSVYYGQGNFMQAVACYAQYVERRWEDVDAWHLLAAALRRAGKFPQAVAIAFNLDVLLRRTASDVKAESGLEWPFHLDQIIRNTATAHSHGD